MSSGTIHEQCWDGSAELSSIKRCVSEGHPALIIMRGVPGSGKTFLARELVGNTNGVIHSTDDYFLKNGVYEYDPGKLQEYHQKNFKEVKKSMSDGITPVIVDNTNIVSMHIKPYVTQAVKHMYEVYFVEPQTHWKTKASECARRNIHQVEAQKISQLIEKYEQVNLKHIIRPLKLKLKPPLEAPANELSFLEEDFAKFYLGLSPRLSEFSSRDPNCVQTIGTVPVNIAQNVNDIGPPMPPINLCQLNTNAVDLCGGIGTSKSFEKLLENEKISRKKSEKMMEKISENGKKLEMQSWMSMVPYDQPSYSPRKSIGFQTSDIIGLLCTIEGGFDDRMMDGIYTKPQLSTVNRMKMEQNAILKNRCTQTSLNTFEPSDLDILLALFPEEASADLFHILGEAGIQQTIVVFHEIGAKMDIHASIEQANDEDISVSQTFKNCETVEMPDFEMDLGPEAKVRKIGHGSNLEKSKVSAKVVPRVPVAECALPKKNSVEKSKSVESGSEPIRNGYYRMQLSDDMVRKLSDLFGDESVSNDGNRHVDLPLWYWRQIYESWQGLPITGRNGEQLPSVDFDEEFPDLLGCKDADIEGSNMDMDIAQNDGLKLHRVMKTKPVLKPRKMDTSAVLKLNELFEKFPDVDKERIKECFMDNSCSSEATEATLLLFVEADGEARPAREMTSSPLSNNTAGVMKGSPPNSRGAGASVEPLDLASAQHETKTLREEIQNCLEKKNELYSKANDSKDPRIKMFYITEAQKMNRQAENCKLTANHQLSVANTGTNFVDLHFMDVSAALTLLRNKLADIDRPQNLRNGRSGRKLNVITGYGKASNGCSKLKPAVIQWLKQMQYEFHCSQNQGEIVVEAK